MTCHIKGQTLTHSKRNTGQFYELYQRALFYIECECFIKAMNDLKNAIEILSQDKRWVNTYGMHYIDYFPHRELGFVNYSMRNYDEAKKELEISIKQESTAKAYYYLDCVKKELLLKSNNWNTQPEITLDKESISTNKMPVLIKGTAKDKHAIKSISINNKKYFIDISDSTVKFHRYLHLPEGRHEIEITASNLVGNTTKKMLAITVDQTGPVIHISTYQPGVVIKGKVIDKGIVRKISIGKKIYLCNEGSVVPFSFELESGINQIIAWDNSGNKTIAFLNKNQSAYLKKNLYASNELTSIDIQNAQPDILLYGLTDGLTIYQDSIIIRGEICGKVNIKSLRINQNEILIDTGPIAHFSRIVSLDEGRNNIQIMGTNIHNQVTRKDLTIYYEKSDVYSISNRYKIKILRDESDSYKSNIKEFYHHFYNNFIQKGRFQIVEKNQSNQSDNSYPQAFIDIVYNETRHGIEITARLTSRKSRSIICVKDVYDTRKTPQSIQMLAKQLSDKFHAGFPLTNGIVAKLYQDHQFLGTSDEELFFHYEMPDFIVYRKVQSKFNPMTGEFWGNQYSVIGHAALTEIRLQGIVARYNKDCLVKVMDLFMNQ